MRGEIDLPGCRRVVCSLRGSVSLPPEQSALMTEVVGAEAVVARGLGRHLAVGATGTMALNVATLVLNFATTLVLSHLLGVDGYGAYAFALAWALVLTSVAGLGLAPLVIRQVASSHATREWAVLRGMLRWSNVLVLVAGLATAAVAGIVGFVFFRDDGELLRPFLVGLLLVVPLSLTMLRQAAMQGIGRVILGRTPESLVAPGLFLVLVAVVGVAMDDRFSSGWAIALQVLATMVAFAVGAVLLVGSLPRDARAAEPEVHAESWRRSALPLFALGVLLAASTQIGTIVVGAIGDPADAGVYSVAARLTAFIGFVMLAATYPLMPLVARLHAQQDDARMHSVVAGSARTIFLLSLPIAVAVIVLAAPLLRLFGAEFDTGSDAVRILAVGELVKAFIGLSGLVLVMTGHEARLTRAVALGVGANVVLALALVPLLGVEGAAIAAAVGMVSTQVLLEIDVRRRAGLSAAAFFARAR